MPSLRQLALPFAAIFVRSLGGMSLLVFASGLIYVGLPLMMGGEATQQWLGFSVGEVEGRAVGIGGGTLLVAALCVVFAGRLFLVVARTSSGPGPDWSMSVEHQGPKNT